MFRSLFRVVVVAVVVLSFTLCLAPVAQAKPQDSRQPAVQVAAQGGWFGAALQWLTRLVAADKPAAISGKKHPMHPIQPTGSCIDPWGICP
jgi:hypothetical protein